MAEKLRTLSLTPKRNFLIKDNECICSCHCSIYDVVASLLLNKASKIDLDVSYTIFYVNVVRKNANVVNGFTGFFGAGCPGLRFWHLPKAESRQAAPEWKKR